MGMFPGERDFERPPETSELASALRDLQHTIEKMLTEAPADHPLKGRSVAQVPGGGFWGGNQAAAVPPPMPGSLASMQGSYGMPIGPQPYSAQNINGPMMSYRPHDVGGAEPGAGLGMDVLGSIPKVLMGSANYAAAKTPYGTTGTTDMLSQNLQMGALKTLAGFAENIPGLGAFAKKQFEGLEEAVYEPTARARGKLSPTFERMAMAGIDVSDKEIKEAYEFALPMERRGVYMKQRNDRISEMVAAEGMSGLKGALSQIGF